MWNQAGDHFIYEKQANLLNDCLVPISAVHPSVSLPPLLVNVRFPRRSHRFIDVTYRLAYRGYWINCEDAMVCTQIWIRSEEKKPWTVFDKFLGPWTLLISRKPAWQSARRFYRRFYRRFSSMAFFVCRLLCKKRVASLPITYIRQWATCIHH